MIPFPSLKEHSDCCGGQRGTDMSPGDGLGEGHIARHCVIEVRDVGSWAAPVRRERRGAFEEYE